MIEESSNDPRWADFQATEFRRRSERARHLMVQQGIDALVCTQRENVEYFSGFQTDHWLCRSFPTAAVVLAVNHDPVLVIPDFFEGNAAQTSWIATRFTFSEPHAMPRGFAQALESAVERVTSPASRIGVEAGPHLVATWNSDDHSVFMERFGDRTVAAGEVIWGCRAIKSAQEVERIRWLAEATSSAIRAARESFRVGMTEIEVARLVNAAAIDAGTSGLKHVNIRAGLDRYAMADTLPQDRPIESSEMLLVDVGCGHRGYVSDMAYVSHFGVASARHHREYQVVIEAQRAGLEALRPGALAREVYRSVLEVLKTSDLKTIDMCGHGIGLDVHEPPMLTPYEDQVIQPGMVLALEPWLYDTTGMGYFCVEEQVLVTEDGSEVLSTVERDRLHEVI